jgi:DNA-binding MarR family transcriptional regulator
MTEKVYAGEACQSTASVTGFNQRIRAGLFAKVPLEIATTRQLSPAAKQVWITLACLQGDNDNAWPGIRTLACFAGLSLSRTKEALSELKKKGFLEHKYDESRRRHSFALQIPIQATEELSKRAGFGKILSRVQASPAPSAAAVGSSRPKAQRQGEARREVDPRAEWEAWNDVTPPDYLREKYEKARGEDSEWDSLPTVSAAQSADQNDNQAPGTEIRPGEVENSTGGGRILDLGRPNSRPRVEASVQSRTASADTYNTCIDKTLEKTSYKKEENSLKDLAPNEEESKSKQNFQLGQEEKSRLGTENSSAESKVLEDDSKNKFTSPSNSSSLPSAGFSQAKGSYFGGLELDPKAIPGAVYARLPVWARFTLSGLSDLRRELAGLEAALRAARGEEKAGIEARIKEIKEEISYSEAGLAQVLAEIGYFAAGTPVTAGAEARE